MLHALQSIKPSQLMDQDLWDFRNLEAGLANEVTINEPVSLETIEHCSDDFLSIV